MIEAHVAQSVRAAEAPLLAAERGFDGGLMHRAATALALAVRRELADRDRVAGSSVVALVGPGNNGGDALHALALLARHGVRVTALGLGALHDGGLAALRAAGGRVLALDDGPGEPVWLGDALAEAFAADVLLDAVLGIGARGALHGTAARVVGLLAGLLDEVPGGPARPVVVAVDVPSGVGVDDGTVPGPVLAADRTVTFGAVKPALLLPPAAALAGGVDVVDLGLAGGLEEHGAGAAVVRLEGPDVAALWPVPGPVSHKYTRGVLGVVAGSTSFPGAGVLTVAGALGAGVGMVRHLGPETVTAAVVAAHPEVVPAPGRVQAWALGPGVPERGEQADRVRDALAECLERGLAGVVDAGGLALLPDRLAPHVVLTPHAGELAALLGARGAAVSRAQVEAEPLRHARLAHELTGATVLLKGATTLVVGPSVVLSQADAPPWLATAGAGDVLTGVVGALLAGLGPHADPDAPARAAAAAAFAHGRAARRANPGGPVTASAVAAALPATVAAVLGGREG